MCCEDAHILPYECANVNTYSHIYLINTSTLFIKNSVINNTHKRKRPPLQDCRNGVAWERIFSCAGCLLLIAGFRVCSKCKSLGGPRKWPQPIPGAVREVQTVGSATTCVPCHEGSNAGSGGHGAPNPTTASKKHSQIRSRGTCSTIAVRLKYSASNHSPPARLRGHSVLWLRHFRK
jgi:hypothetical protein